MRTVCSGERPITSVLVVKPQTAAKHLPKVLKRITHEGFRIVAWRQTRLTDDHIQRVVPKNDQKVLTTSAFY